MMIVFGNRTVSCLIAFSVLALMSMYGLIPVWIMGVIMVLVMWMLIDQEPFDYNDED